MSGTRLKKFVLVLIGLSGLAALVRAQVRNRHVQCYACGPQFSLDCVEEQNVHDCVYGVHDSCQVTVTVYPDDRRLYQRACATYSTCIGRQRDAWDNWLCNGAHVGSQCTYCCNASRCNSLDPTYLDSGGPRISDQQGMLFMSCAWWIASAMLGLWF